LFSIESGRHRILAVGVVALVVAVMLSAQTARSQTPIVKTTPAGTDVPVVLSGVVPSHLSGPTYHILRANTEVGKHTPLLFGPVTPSNTGAVASVTALAKLPKPGFYPADLSFFGGTVIQQGNSLNVYYNCTDSSCFGDPEQFQTDLAKSRFIHVVDQYVGSKADNRYPLSTTPPLHINGSATFFSAADIANMAASAASSAGPGHIFHIFLPQGVDTCLDPENTVCYSPDNPATFGFCAYHSATSVGDVDVFYTVIPYEGVPECMLPTPNPHGALIDTANSALLHELFETISDPVPGSGWVADSSTFDTGLEMADICQGQYPSYVLVKGHTFQTQLVYSNFRHACVAAP
jgi:hypothetical protein